MTTNVPKNLFKVVLTTPGLSTLMFDIILSEVYEQGRITVQYIDIIPVALLTEGLRSPKISNCSRALGFVPIVSRNHRDNSF